MPPVAGRTPFTLEGRRAIVTGAGSGIGRSAAIALSAAGADVLLVDVAEQAVAGTAAQVVAAGGSSHSVVADVRSDADVDAVGTLAARLGGAHILVNCAGVMRRATAEESTLEDLDAVWAVNFRGLYAVTQRVLPQLCERRGKIINVGSLGSILGLEGRAAYAATKGAVRQYTQSLAVELGKCGVCVNAVAPGYIQTSMNDDYLDEPSRRARMLERIPLGRLGRPSDIDGAFVFLASAASDYLTGQVVVVDGGWSSW